MLIRISLIMICALASGCFLTEKSIERKVSSRPEQNKSENEKWEWKIKDGRVSEYDINGIDVDIQFEEVEVKEVIKLVMGIIKENYIVVGNLVGYVDVEIKGMFLRLEILKMIRAIVNSKGYDIVRDGEIYRIYNVEEEGNINIKNTIDPSKNIYLYHLQYESTENVVSILNDVFDDSEITQNKNINMIIIKGSKDEYVKIRDVIRKIDKRPKQVFVEFTIMEVSLTNGLKYGVEYFVRENKLRGGNISLLPSGVNTGQGNIISDGIKAFAIHTNYREFITMLRSETKVDIISKPNVLVQDGQRSVINVGREEPIKKGTTVSANGLASENIEYRDVGIILNVKVEVEESDIVKLLLKQEISDVVSATVNPLISSPSFTKTSIEMSALIKDGDNIYIGGLIEKEENKKIKKVPLLGDIPYLGKLFRSEDIVKTKTELILLLSVDVLNKESDFDRQKIKFIRKA